MSDMDMKKSVFVSLLILITGLGVFFVYGGVPSYTGTGYSISVGLSENAYSLNNVTRGGTNETINFTITMASGLNDAEDNVTVIAFETPINVVMNDYANVSNGTIPGWSCVGSPNSNVNSSTHTNWTCTNVTPSQVGAGDAITIKFNFTANLTGTDEDIEWNISLDGVNASGDNNPAEIRYLMRLDDSEPRLINMNITDGNTTLYNGSTGLDPKWAANLTNYLRPASVFTVQATIIDAQLESKAYMYYLCNSTIAQNVSDFIVPDANKVAVDITPGDSSLFSAEIPTACALTGDSNVTNFVIVFNDTVNHHMQYNDTSIDTAPPFSVSINSSLIKIKNVSMDDGTYSRTLAQLTAANSVYLRANGNLTLYVDIEGIRQNSTSAYIVYNTTGAPVKDKINFTSLNADEFSGRIRMTNNSNSTYIDDYAIRHYNVNLSGFAAAANTTQTVYFYVVANDTEGGGNTVAIGGPYLVTLDSDAPAEPTMTPPSDRTIGTSDSIAYKCTTSDSGIGTLTAWQWTLTRPGGASTVTKEGGTTVSDTMTFSSSDFGGNAGEYNVKCEATDGLGNTDSYTTVSTQTFSVLYSSSGSSSSTTSSGGGADGEATPSFDIDFSGDILEGTLKDSEGRIRTFSFDGATTHKITFKEVGTDSVTLKIESDPVEVTLNVGDTKEVDVNGDGVNDLSITLNSVTGGKADIAIKKIEEGAEIVAKEDKAKAGIVDEEPPAPPAAEEQPPVVEEKSNAWLWILLLVVVVVGVVAYFVMKKK